MQGTRDLGPLRNVTTIATMMLFLGGCLSEDEAAENEVSADVAIETEYEVSGSVGDGPVVGAAMRVMQNDGVLLNEFQSDASAGYNIVVKTKGKFYPLIVDAQNGTDLVTNQAPDFTLIGAALEPSAKSVVNVNPFSTLAMEIARDLPGGPTKANIYAAQGIAYTAMNFGLVSLGASGPMTATIDSGNVAEIVKSSEALGEVVRRTRDWLLTAGFTWDGDSVIQALGSDLIDGVIDGFGGPRADPRAAAIANIVIAQVLLESTGNELHVNGADATASLEIAIQTMNLGTASPALGDLTANGAMLGQASAGLAAADAISDDVRITDLRQTVTGLQPGLQPDLAQSILPPDYRQIIDDVLLLLINGGADTIATVNDVVRNGGAIPGNNSAPQIAGTPGASAEPGSMYQFQPTASDPDGDTLIFSVSNRPTWVSFEPTTGSLSGMPGDSDIGFYFGIIVSVSDGKTTTSLEPFTISVSSPFSNDPPAIWGMPPAVVTVNSPYSFTPNTFDPENDPLTFSVAGLPAWANFNSSDGSISGTPGDANVGTHTGIVITVSDGQHSANLGPFSVTVEATSLGSATLSWQPPTQYEDGTPLTPPDFAGYKIYWGTTPGDYPNSVTVNNPGLSSYMVENLAPGDYEFVATAFNAAGMESQFSNSVTKTIP